jgi:hypothetical protein
MAILLWPIEVWFVCFGILYPKGGEAPCANGWMGSMVNVTGWIVRALIGHGRADGLWDSGMVSPPEREMERTTNERTPRTAA